MSEVLLSHLSITVNRDVFLLSALDGALFFILSISNCAVCPVLFISLLPKTQASYSLEWRLFVTNS